MSDGNLWVPFEVQAAMGCFHVVKWLVVLALVAGIVWGALR